MSEEQKPHYITSRAELRRILERVHSGAMSINEAYGHIDCTLYCGSHSLADWLEQKAKELRDANPKTS